MPTPQTRNLLLTVLLPAAVAAAIAAPVILLFAAGGFDYKMHMRVATRMLETGDIITPHFLLQFLVILLTPLLGGIPKATVALVLLAEGATAAIAARYLHADRGASAFAGPVAVALLFVAPVAILFPLDRHLYLGYIGINPFHNPTMFVLKPLALLSFILTVRALETETRLPTATLCASLLLTVACASAKPSYTIVILPALALLFARMIVARRRFDWQFLLFSIIVPAGVILLLQYKMAYNNSQLQDGVTRSGGIIFAPLLVMQNYSAYLLPKLLLSLLFPLTVLAVFFRQACRDTALQLAWLACGAGCFYTYFLAESGPRMFDANFSWSAQVSLFILFVVSAGYLLETVARHRHGVAKTKLLLCGTAFLLHLCSGIGFYIASLVMSELY